MIPILNEKNGEKVMIYVACVDIVLCNSPKISFPEFIDMHHYVCFINVTFRFLIRKSTVILHSRITLCCERKCSSFPSF